MVCFWTPDIKILLNDVQKEVTLTYLVIVNKKLQELQKDSYLTADRNI